MPSEEERAIEYRRMMKAREANSTANEKRLAGSESARKQLILNWEPLILALRENRS